MWASVPVSVSPGLNWAEINSERFFFFPRQTLFSLSARAGEQKVSESWVTECLVTVKNTIADNVCAEVVSEIQGADNMPFLIVFLQLRIASAEIKGILQGRAQKRPCKDTSNI